LILYIVDHGCDALVATFTSLILAASLGLGLSGLTVMLVFGTTVGFYASTWEEYHTGILFLDYVNGPTEGLLMVSLTCTMTAICGGPAPIHGFALSFISSILGNTSNNVFVRFLEMMRAQNPILSEISFIDASVCAYVFISLVLHIPGCMQRVFKSSLRKDRKTTFTNSLLQLVPATLFFIINCAWMCAPLSRSRNDLMCLLLIGSAIVFGRFVTRVILAHVTRSEFPFMPTRMVLPLTIGALLAHLTPEFFALYEKQYLIAYVCAAVVSYGFWATKVITTLSNHLGIQCFSLTKYNTD
jgi:ethanolaminephosphotransferase